MRENEGEGNRAIIRVLQASIFYVNCFSSSHDTGEQEKEHEDEHTKGGEEAQETEGYTSSCHRYSSQGVGRGVTSAAKFISRVSW